MKIIVEIFFYSILNWKRKTKKSNQQKVSGRIILGTEKYWQKKLDMSGEKEDPRFFSRLNLFFNCYLFTKLSFDTEQQVKKNGTQLGSL